MKNFFTREKLEAYKARAIAFAKTRKAKWIGAVILFFLVVYGAIGIFYIPGVIKEKAQQFVAEKFDRKLEIKNVSMNPFTLSVTIEGLKLSEHGSDEEFVSFDSLYVNASSQSIFRMAPVLEEIHLVNPKVRLVRSPDNHYNFDDFIAFATKPDEDPKPKEEKGETHFSLNNIKIDNAYISFADGPQNRTHVVDQLNLSVPFISSIPSNVDIFTELSVSGRINGENIAVAGKARPFFKEKDGTVNIKLSRISLPAYLDYVPVKPNFILKDGKLSVDMNVGFTKPEDGAMGLVVDGKVTLDSFEIQEKSGKPAVKLPELTVNLAKSDVLGGTIDIASILLKDPEIFLERDKAGKWNFEQFSKFESTAKQPAAKGAKKAGVKAAEEKAAEEKAKAAEETAAAETEEKPAEKKAMTVKLGKFSIAGGKFHVVDEIHSIPGVVTVNDFGLDIENAAVDLGSQNATVEKVASTGTDIYVLHEKIASAAAPAKAAGGAKEAPSKPEAKPAQVKKAAKAAVKEASEKSGFNFLVKKIDISGWKLKFEEKDGGKQPLITRMENLSFTVDNLSSEAGQEMQVAIGGKVNDHGKIDISGNLSLKPLKGAFDINMHEVDVRFVQPYINDYVNMTVRQADLTVKGKFQMAQGAKGIEGRFTGDAGIRRLQTADQVTRDAFVSWDSFELKGIVADLSPLSVSIDLIRLDGLGARIILSSQGRLNVQDILRSEAGGQKSLTKNEEGEGKGKPAETAKAEEAAPEPAPAPAAQAPSVDEETESTADASDAQKAAEKKGPPPYKINIKRYVLSNSMVRFSDNFIRPRYTANLMNLRGEVTGLSTDPDKQAKVMVRGRVNGAPLAVDGTVNPLSEKLWLDIKASVKGMELAQFSAYSGKYIGYGIKKGKLSFDVAYKIENDQLTAENQLILDQLTLGDKVESEEAMNLPIGLAISLLKDRNGVIDINLPIGGSLNDPSFSVGGIIVKVIVNLITKAVTSPFSLIGSLIPGGGGEELSFIAFEPGFYTLTDTEIKKLETLAKVMEDRPGISLEITGKFDPEADKNGYGLMVTRRKVQALKAASAPSKDGAKAKVTPEEYPDYLKKLYNKEDFKKPRNWIGLTKSLSVSEMEGLLAEHFAGKPEDMRLVANQRAQTVKEWLVNEGKVAEDRLFILESAERKTEGDTPGSRVDFSMK